MESNQTILLALSDAKLAMAVGLKLREAGWKVDPVRKGKDAIKRFKTDPSTAVLAPMLLPDMTGATLLREIRQWGGEIPILILLASAVGGKKLLEQDARANAVVDPRQGIEGILKALEHCLDAETPGSTKVSAATSHKPTGRARVATPGDPAPLPDRGNINTGSLLVQDTARLVGCVRRFQLTGRLIFETSGKERREIYFEKGIPVFAASSILDERIGSHLVRRGIITPGELSAALRASQKGKKLGQLLVDMGAIESNQVEPLVQEHIRERLIECFKLRSGNYSFAEEPISPPDRPQSLPLALELLRLGVQAHYSANDVEKYLPKKTRLETNIPIDELSQLARLNHAGIQLLSRLNGQLSVHEASKSFPNPVAAHQLYYALYAGGVLTKTSQPKN